MTPKNNPEEVRGLVFLIQRYSLQDGPGLRTTVFMKGCPLKCRWCQNPESWEPYPTLMTHDTRCLLLGKCAQACPTGAINISPQESRSIDRKRCDRCFKCVVACPAKTLTRVGEYMTLDQIMTEIEHDETFYHRSGGGVTISGGEPLLQGQFVSRLLKACKQKRLHTALDTCGYVSWPVLQEALQYTDLVLYDIKHMDSRCHKEATGKPNRLILTNLRKLAPKVKVWLRVPLIPGFNDSERNLIKIAELGREIGTEKVSILPYHRLGEEKYNQLGKPYVLAGIIPPEKERLQEVRDLIKRFGLEVTIGS